jgi:MFS family permease
MRIGVQESGMYKKAMVSDEHEGTISRGNFFALFTDKDRFVKYLKSILIGLPTWFMIGILVQRTASHFGPANNIQGPLLTSRAVALSYLGASVGDLLSGILSQIIKSRKKAVVIFLAYSSICVFIFLYFTNGWTNTSLYALIFIMGFGRGYWAIFVTIAAE